MNEREEREGERGLLEFNRVRRCFYTLVIGCHKYRYTIREGYILARGYRMLLQNFFLKNV